MKMNKRLILNSLAIGGVAVIGAIATTGVSFAATNPTAADSLFSRVSQILGIDNTKLTDAVKQASNEQIDQMVKDGKITQSQADKMKQHIAQGNLKGIGNGFGGPHNMKGGMMSLDDTATFLGIKKDDLMNDLQNGQKLSDIVTSKGKTTTDLKTYLTKQETDRINQMLKNGKITQTQADDMLKNLSTRLDDFINGNMPKFKGKGRMMQNNSTTDNNTTTN